MMDNRVSVRVWGDFACFTRPEMKVERVSYPVITPSAARGILEAIFWEPQIFYIIDSVRIVKKGRWISFRRNEVTKNTNIKSAANWMKDPSSFSPIIAGGGSRDGTQRNMLALKDVEYIITAQVKLTDVGIRAGQNISKYFNEIRRRASQGKCFHRPALGMREFAADFEYEEDPQAAHERRAKETRSDESWQNIWPEEDLGLMLYDVFDLDKRTKGFRWLDNEQIKNEKAPKSSQQKGKRLQAKRHEGISITPSAAFFDAKVRNSILDCNPQRVTIISRNN